MLTPAQIKPESFDSTPNCLRACFEAALLERELSRFAVCTERGQRETYTGMSVRLRASEFRGCVKVEVAVLGSPS